MKKLLGLVLGLTLSFVAVSQENFLPGYIVTNGKDTIQGYIDYRYWKTNPSTIYFRKTLTAETLIYPPTHIAAFSVRDEFHEAAVVDIEVSPDEEKNFTFESEFKIEKQTAFIRALIPGEKGLYALVNGNAKPNYYIKYNGKLQLLLYKRYLQERPGSSNYLVNSKQTITINQFLLQLETYLNDCPTISTKLPSVQYTKRSLEELVSSYFTCIGREALVVKPQKSKPRWSIMAGVGFTNLKVKGTNKPLLTEAEYSSSTDFNGGVGLDLILPANRWSIVGELLYTSYEIEGKYEHFESEDRYVTAISTFKNSYLKLNVLSRVKFRIKRSSPFLNFGLSNGFAIKQENSQEYFRKFMSTEESRTRDAVDETKKYEIGVLLGAGVMYGRFTLQGRYEASNGFTPTTMLSTKVSNFKILFSYQLNKS